MERVADYVVRRLAENNIEHIFVVTGRGILYLTDAVAKNENIHGVSTYHEQGASYAAMSYSAARDEMSACLVSTGCAATNAVTAVLCAWQDNLPVVFISGQNILDETTRHTGVPIRTYGSQEADIIGIVQPITKYAVMVKNGADIRSVMDKAFYMANEGRKGPVWIDIPLDIQNARIEADELQGYSYSEAVKHVSDSDIEYVRNQLEKSERPIIFIGGGVRSSGAVSAVKKLVEKFKIPAVFSTSAADTYGCGNELSIGAVGSLGGSRAGNFAVQNTDFVLVLGSKLCSQTTGNAEHFAREAKVVAVDIDKHEHTKSGVKFEKIICADVNDFVTGLLECDIQITHDLWVDKCRHWKETFSVKNEPFVKDNLKNGQMDLYYFADVLSEKLPIDAAVITDAGFEELIIPSAINYHGEQRCLFPASQGAMGYAIPAIVGAHFAGKKDIITVVGDGSFMMNMQELLVISSNHIPVKIFVINNDMYAVIRKRQKDLFRTRTIGNDPSDGVAAPDFKKIADTFGFEYFAIKTADELAGGLDEVMECAHPVICEVYCDKEQKYLHTSFAINKAKKIVKRSLEDLSPFMDRDIFYAEMLSEPLEKRENDN